MNVDLKKGDVILTGRFKNRRQIVKSLGTDDLGQPTVNGMKLLTLRIEKTLPKRLHSKETRKMDKQAFTDGYMNKQAGPSALARVGKAVKPYAQRGFQTVKNWASDPTGRRAGQAADAAGRTEHNLADAGARYADDLHRPMTDMMKWTLGKPGYNGEVTHHGVREAQHRLWKQLTERSAEAGRTARKNTLAEAGRPAATAAGLAAGGSKALDSVDRSMDADVDYNHYVKKGLSAPGGLDIKNRRKELGKGKD